MTATDWIVWVGVLVLAVPVGGSLVRIVLRLATNRDRLEAATAEDGANLAAPPVVLRGGPWIGYLERLGVAVAVLAGQPQGIAYLIAIKGLGRYPELRQQPGAAERFVIGTFASMIWATAVAAGGAALLASG